jgi:hypothetical protein
MHVTVDPAARNEIVVGIAAAQAPLEAGHTRYALRTAARAHGWQVLIDNGPYPSDTYLLPDKSKRIEVSWAASGGVLIAIGGDGPERSYIWRGEDSPTKTERVLSALASRTDTFPPARENDATRLETSDRSFVVREGECPPDSIRAEIEQILIDHPRTRYAKVLLGMRRRLSDAQMAEEAAEAGEPINAESIAHVRKLVRLSLDDELVSAPSDAAGQAGLYRELLNYRRSPELTQHINTKLAKLRKLDPKILLTPLGSVHLGANDPSKPEKPERVCPDCFMVHAGECP